MVRNNNSLAKNPRLAGRAVVDPLIRTQLSSSESEMKYGNNKCMEQGTSREENAAAAPYAAGKQVGRRRKGPANKLESSSSEREGRGRQALPIAICHLVDASLSLSLSDSVHG